MLERLRNRLHTHGLGHLVGVPARRVRNELRIRREQRQYCLQDYRQVGVDRFAADELADFSACLQAQLSANSAGLAAYLDGFVERHRDDAMRRATLLVQSRDACRGRFLIYGRQLDLGPDVDWCADIDGGGRWPGRFFRRYRFGYRATGRGDPRHVFELNRQQHLPLLVVASRVSGDEVFARCAAQHMLQWIRDNPVFHSVNWASSMEPALRLFSWGLTLALLAGHYFPDTGSLRRILVSLYQQYRFVIDTLSVDLQVSRDYVALKNNHTIIELCGVLFARSLFGWLREFSAGNGPETFEQLLIAELERQTWHDGMNVEQSTSYHRFVLEALLLVRLVDSDRKVNPHLDEFIGKYHAALEFFCSDDGNHRILILGDDDNGHVNLPAGRPRPGDVSEVRAMSAVLGLEHRPPAMGVSVLRDSGHWICRWRWEKRDMLLYLRAGPMDFPDLPGYAPHAHGDLLGICLYMDGQGVLVDTGTYSYCEQQWRDGFRAEPAHNTVAIRGCHQVELSGPFSSRRHARAGFTKHGETGVTASLTYVGESQPRIVRRVQVNLQEGCIEVSDQVVAEPGDTIEWYLNPAPRSDQLSSTGFTFDGVRFALSGLTDLDTVPAWFSPAYGEKQPITRLVARTHCAEPCPVRHWKIGFHESVT